MEDDGLQTSSVPRALEMKSKMFGYELPDLILIFMNLAVTNLIFGASKYRYALVWGTTATLAAFLFFAKRGKPDGYLQHLIQFWVKPSFLSSGGLDRFYRPFDKKQIDKRTEDQHEK